MRIVADTNTVVSGSLWPGKSRALLAAARAGEFQLVTTQALLDELLVVLARARFAGRIERAGATVAALLAAYRDLAEVVVPAQITPTVIADPDDAHLLNLKRFHHIRILTVSEALAVIARLRA